MHQNLDERLDETTALLPAKEPKPVTPLPRVQIGILLLLQLAEPITSQCIYPFVNQVITTSCSANDACPYASSIARS